jgi:hypothetical protein
MLIVDNHKAFVYYSSKGGWAPTPLNLKIFC